MAGVIEAITGTQQVLREVRKAAINCRLAKEGGDNMVAFEMEIDRELVHFVEDKLELLFQKHGFDKSLQTWSAHQKANTYSSVTDLPKSPSRQNSRQQCQSPPCHSSRFNSSCTCLFFSRKRKRNNPINTSRNNRYVDLAIHQLCI